MRMTKEQSIKRTWTLNAAHKELRKAQSALWKAEEIMIATKGEARVKFRIDHAAREVAAIISEIETASIIRNDPIQ